MTKKELLAKVVEINEALESYKNGDLTRLFFVGILENILKSINAKEQLARFSLNNKSNVK